MNKIIAQGLRLILPDRLRRALVHISYHVEPNEFARFAHVYCISPSMEVGLTSVAKRGFQPRTIVDVGAYEGGWTREAKQVWPSATTILVEANRAKLSKLDGLGEVYCALLGADHGKVVEFNLMETGSSILSENSSVQRSVESRTITTLDHLNLPILAPGFLKIDAQGYEIEILKGATEVLPAFEAILLEIALIEINKGAPLLHEVTSFMDRLGFVACEVFELHRRPLDRALSQMDIFFVRKDSRLASDKRYSD